MEFKMVTPNPLVNNNPAFSDARNMMYDPNNKIDSEIVIGRNSVISPYKEPFKVPTKYLPIFRKSHLTWGENTVRYPVSNLGLSRLLTSFLKEFPGFKLKQSSPIFEDWDEPSENININA